MLHAALCVGAATDMPAVLVELALFQCRTRLCVWCSQRSPHQGGRIRDVSMPHAALCGAAPVRHGHPQGWCGFNAARSFVGGAAFRSTYLYE